MIEYGFSNKIFEVRRYWKRWSWKIREILKRLLNQINYVISYPNTIWIHNSSSCISVDGEIKFAFNEDRFAKIKNEVGLPIKSAKKCIESLGIDPSEIDWKLV